MAIPGNLTKDDVVDQVLSARTESIEARRVKDAWSRRAWNSYNNIHDWSKKEDWQTQMAIPKFGVAIDQATSLLKSNLKRAQRLFGIEVLNNDPIDELLASFFSAVLHERMRQMDITSVFAGNLKVGLLTNQGIMKVGWENTFNREQAPVFVEAREETRDPNTGEVVTERQVAGFDTVEVQRGISQPTVTIVDPLKYYPDPRNLGLYKLQEVTQELWWVLENFQGQAIPGSLKDLIEDRAQSRPMPTTSGEVHELDEKNRAEIIPPENAWRVPVKLTEYWGPLFERERPGKLVAKNQLITIANDKHLLRVITNPFWDGDDPFVHWQPISVPFSPWGKLLVQHTDHLQTYINELISLMTDKGKLSALGVTEVDVTLLDDVEDIVTGMFPGKVFKTRGPGAVRELDIKGAEQSEFALYGLLSQEMQNAHGVTEFIQGLPSARGRATATEVQSKTAQSAQFFDGILQEYNDSGMEKVFVKLYSRMMQFQDDWEAPAIRKIADRFGMTPILQALTPVERYRLMNRPFRFHAAGLNAAIRRGEVMQRLLEIMQVVGQLGPEFAQRLNFDKVFEKIVDAFDFHELMQQAATSPNVITPGPGDNTQQFPGPELEDGQLPRETREAVQRRTQAQ